MARPKRSDIDILRTKVWYEWIRTKLNLKTAYEMDLYFGSETDRNWYKYESGVRVPTHATLYFVESKCVGSRVIFDDGPNGSNLWRAISAPHSDLWSIVDIYFPAHVVDREAGILGLLQYANFLQNSLILEKYASNIDYLSHAKGLQRSFIEIALERNEISINYELASTVIAIWRLSALVIYNMLNADYLLGGLISAFNKAKINQDNFEQLIGEFLRSNLISRPLGK